MELDRWKRINQLLDAALELVPEQRIAFLEKACSGDEDLKLEVEKLLASDAQAHDFMEKPALEKVAESVAKLKLNAGQSVGPYRILSLIGAGGMGEVYEAEDTRLKRKVAIKVLSSHLAINAEGRLRFQREARAASSLSHPNICSIHDVGQHQGVDYMVLEYIEGKTLAKLIDTKPLPTEQVKDIGIQVADALQEAHSKGIIHRDLKPSNIIIISRNRVKVLDFGLAKLIRSPMEVSASEMTTIEKTRPGILFGTVLYMSPEQALGHDVDQRTDIFSLGIVLYQMATGRLPFTGSTSGEILDHIIHSEPKPVISYNKSIPAELERVISKCLEKSPERRYQSAGELLSDLQNLNRNAEGTHSMRIARRKIILALSLSLIVAAITLISLKVHNRPIDSLAILPFSNASGDPNSEYLCDGITDTLIGNLSQLSNLRIMAHATVFRYKQKEINPQKVGKELNVRAILIGSVNQQGEKLIINAELVNVRDGSHLWGESYSRNFSDIFSIQQEISKEISRSLRLKLSGKEQQQLAKNYTDNVQAYRFYLAGRYYLDKGEESEIRKALEFFRKALDLDPYYALAYAGISDTYYSLSYAFLPPEEAMPKARAAALKALEIDETLAEAHTSLAIVYTFYDWDWPGAEKAFRRAIELKPAYAAAHQWYGWYLALLQRGEESLSEEKIALDLDPLSRNIQWSLGVAYCFNRKYDLAIQQLHQALELGELPLAHFFLGLSYLQKQMFKESITEFEKTKMAHLAFGDIGYVYAVSGKRAQAQTLLTQLKEMKNKEYVPSYGIALLCVGLGQKDEAFQWMKKSYEERNELLTWIKVEPRFDSIRSDPRFTEMLKLMKLD